MTVLDGPMRAVAKNLLGTVGTVGTIEYISTGAYNPSTGEAPSGADSSTQARGTAEDYRDSEINGTTVKRGDVKWTVHAKGIDRPKVNDLATLAGVRYTIMDVGRVMSGDEAALYVLQLRA